MDRLEFCKMMKEAREKSGISVSDVSYQSRIGASSIYEIEKAKKNCQLPTIFRYLSAFGGVLVIYDNHTKKEITQYDQLREWLLKSRWKDFSQYKLADLVGVNITTISYIHLGKGVLTLDMFLKVLLKLNYSIDIKTTVLIK